MIKRDFLSISHRGFGLKAIHETQFVYELELRRSWNFLYENLQFM